ncbi:MAG: restriction endonuclease subunit S [Peptococcaceae bacterium]|nr:restriction endonuclease subunit S [Peptococcaceae bacterium]
MRVKLGEVCRFINGDRGKNYPSQAEISNDGDVPFINAGHIDEGKLNFSEMNYISKEKYDQLNSGKIQKNDVLYCLRGSLGKKTIVKDISKGAIASSLVIIRPDADKIDSDYLYYALESPTVQKQMIQANNGSSQPNLSAKSVSEYTFNLPDINTQRIVVSKLGIATYLIDLRKQQLSKLDELVKARFVELFEDGESPIKTVEELCSAIVDCPHTTPKYEGELKNPAIRTTEIKKGYIAWETMRYVSDEEYEERTTRLKPEAGDIVYGREGTFGNAAILPKGYHFCLGQRVMLLRPDYSKCTSEYLLYAVISDDVYRQAVGKNNASTVAHVNVKDVKQFKIPLPSFDKQNQFAAFVEQTDKSKLAVLKSLEELETLKKSLMQQYFG